MDFTKNMKCRVPLAFYYGALVIVFDEDGVILGICNALFKQVFNLPGFPSQFARLLTRQD